MKLLRSNKMHLKKEEKNLLWKKYIRIGLSEEEINEKFKHEFYKMMQKLEAEE